MKYGIFFILNRIKSCSQAVAEKLKHATLKCQSNKEKNILYCLVRLIRYCKKDCLSGRSFLRSGDYQTRLKLFFQRPKLSWTAKFSHSTQLKHTKTAAKLESSSIFLFQNWLADRFFFYFHMTLTTLYKYIEKIKTCQIRSYTIKIRSYKFLHD